MAEQFNHRQFSGLALLPTSLLEEIIRTDFSGEANYSEEMIQYVLEVIARRRRKEEEEQPEALPDIQAAWENLQLQLDAEDRFNLSDCPMPQKQKKQHRRCKHIVRSAAVIAACVAALFAILITAQAMGADIFGTLAKWTDNTFRFEVEQGETTKITEDAARPESALDEVLAELDMPSSLVPAWIPKEYTLTHIDRIQTKFFQSACATYMRPNGEKQLTIELEQYFDTAALTYTRYEKSSGEPESYIKNGKKFYLFENCGTWTAAWSDASFGITIAGLDSKETTTTMIDSIQEVTHE